MLTRIEIDGFKSFEDFALDLNPFTVVVGPNAVGKSNLFDALRLLSHMVDMDDLGRAFSAVRGEPEELFRVRADGRPVDRIKMAVEVLLDPEVRDRWGESVTLRHTRLRYEVEVQRRADPSGLGRLVISREEAVAIRAGDDRWKPWGGRPLASFREAYFRYGRRNPKFLSMEERHGSGQPTFYIHQDGMRGHRTLAGSAEATVLSSFTTAQPFPHLYALREEIRAWQFLQLDPAALRSPSPRNAPDSLTSDGSNLAAVLQRIAAETRSETRPSGSLSDIAADLSRFVPGFSRLIVEPYDEERFYRLRLDSEEGPFSAKAASDGTLRILALLALLHDPRHHGVVCFEEPENGIHPGSLSAFLEMLRLIATSPDDAPNDPTTRLSQLLLNSHSPVVLSHLREGEIVFADVVTTVDPATKTRSRRTRMRPVIAQQGARADESAAAVVTPFEVKQYLQTVKRQSA